MHQPLDEQSLFQKEESLRKTKLAEERNYIRYTQAAVRALDYFHRFKRLEDWSENSVQEQLNFLRDDSRRYLVEVAELIKSSRARIDRYTKEIGEIAQQRRELKNGK